ncbi:MAG: site-2 protease family protein [Chloroflexi bacterium]|nr:site-2 protease family protein [Chloroflexota bacterium]
MTSSSIRLGKFLGIEVGLNYSLLFIAALVTFQLSSLILPNQAPGYSELVYWLLGMATAVVFFFSILWHEFAHALMAKVFKVRVRRIVLFFMGGVAEIEEDPRTPTAEFWIALVGPLSSLLLGGIFMGLYLPLGRHDIYGEMFFWLGEINIILAAFNMIPAFPLDGGRVFRAIFWFFSKNYLQATRLASYLSQGFAYLAILSGILSLFTGRVLMGSGLWGIFLGWFLLSAAKNHLQTAQVRESLRGIPLGRLVRQGQPLNPDWPLAYAIDRMAIGGTATSSPVIRDGHTIGFLSLDVLRRIPRIGWGGVRVENVMTPISSVRAVDAYQDLYDTLRNEDLQREPYLLVTANQQPIGLLSQRELIAFAEQQARGI